MDNPYVYRNVSRVVFQILYVDNILLIENDITLLHERYERNNLCSRNKDLYKLI